MLTHPIKRALAIFIIIVSFLLAGCARQPAAAPAPANDLLSKILARGTILVATDSDYAPQSKLLDGVARAKDSRCAPNESTANQLSGFDVGAAVELARRLGVEACFVTPQWSQIISGSWDGRWDVSVGSMALTEERLRVLYFSQPYYATPAALFINKENTTYMKVEDLSGKRIGTCTGCGYEDYLRGKLVMPNNPLEFFVHDPQIIGYQVDAPALKDLSEGDGVFLDAVLTSQPTGLQAIKDGMNIKQLGEPVFFEYLSMTVDKKSKQDSLSLAKRINEIVQQMHADGALKKLSERHYGMDYASVAAKFDIQPLNQYP